MPEKLKAEDAETLRSEQWSKEFLQEERPELEKESATWQQALDGKFGTPLSPEGKTIKAQMEGLLARNSKAMEWLDGGENLTEGRLAAADILESRAELRLWMARNNMGGERLVEGTAEDSLTPQEEEFIRSAGELFYHADKLRY